MVLTLDIHHIEYVADGGGDGQENLLPLCPNCHSLHHKGHIPKASLRAWKLLLLALNEGFDRRSVDALLALDALGGVMLWGDGLLTCASLVASGLVAVQEKHEVVENADPAWFSYFGPIGLAKEIRIAKYWIELSNKGRAFVEAWKKGDQDAAIRAANTSKTILSKKTTGERQTE